MVYSKVQYLCPTPKKSSDLEKPSSWSGQWHLHFDPTITEYLISSAENTQTQHEAIYLETKELHQASTYKHLRLALDNKLT